MNPLNTLSALLDEPACLLGAERPSGLGRTGLLGYFTGALGLFVYLRMFSAVPPGVMSFGVVLLLALAANFLYAAIIHLFLDLTSARGSAARLFLAFGCSDFLAALLVPMAFFVKLDYFGAFLAFCLVALAVIYARVRLVSRLYPVSSNKAALAVWLPYAGFSALFFFGFVYAVAWLVWLIA